MESYKYVTLSLMLLLSIPLSTFCMEDLEDGVHFNATAGSSNSSIISSAAGIGDGANDMPALDDNDDNESAISQYYTPRASIEYKGLETFDKRSVDDLAQDQAFQALLLEIQTNSKTPAAVSTSQFPPVPQMVMGAGAAGVLASAITTATPAIRGIRLDDTKTLPVLATEAVFKLFKSCGAEVGLVIALGVLIAETRKTVHIEDENKRLTRQVKALDDAVRRGTLVIRKHELVEQGMIATEHKVLKGVHNYLCEEAGLIAKGSDQNQAVATLKAILAKNQKITRKVVLAMADLEKIHTDSATLLKDEKQYSMLNPLGWFEALKNLCHKHSADDATAEDKK